MSFHEPAYIGEVVTLKAKLAYTSPRSMMVVVKATAENSMAQTSRHTNTAVLWYVGLDAKDPSLRQVAEIPAFVPSNQEEEQLFATGAALYHQRKKFELESTYAPKDFFAFCFRFLFLDHLASSTGSSWPSQRRRLQTLHCWTRVTTRSCLVPAPRSTQRRSWPTCCFPLIAPRPDSGRVG